jgi:uncharacterized protein (TIGR03083 family)
MTKEAVEVLRTEHAAILEAAEGWTPEQWAAPSACEGWRVQDVLTHMTQTFQSVTDPSALPARDEALPFERQLDQMAAALADLPPDEVLIRYRDIGKQAADALEGLQALDSPIDVPGLGSYPLHLIANAYAFDAYTHFRIDLLQPRGPLDGEAPPATDAHMNAAMDWMFAALPQMSSERLAPIAETVNLTIEGPGARTVNVTAGSVADGPSADAKATVTSTAADFVLWATKREPAEGRVKIEGDHAIGKAFADALHVF